jgi:excisionase family DNA binding protein
LHVTHRTAPPHASLAHPLAPVREPANDTDPRTAHARNSPPLTPKRRARPRTPGPASAVPRTAPDDQPPTEAAAALHDAAPDTLLYTPEQAGRLLNISAAWLRRAAGQGRIPATYLGKHLRFSHQDLTEAIAAARRPASTT